MRIKNTLNKYLNKLDIHTLEVVKKSSASIVVKVAGMAIALGVSIFLGRTIGADGLGIINLANRIVNILLVVGLLGMRQMIIKEVAIAHGKGDYEHIGNVMYTAYWLNGITTLVLSVMLILLSPWLANTVFNEPRLTYPLMIALVVMTPQVFSRIFSSGLIGYHKIWQSNLVDQTLSIGVTGLLLSLLWVFKMDINVNLVAISYGIGRIGVTISVGIYWRSLYRSKLQKYLIGKSLLKTSLPLYIVALANIVTTNIDVIMLGWLSNTKDIGLYTVAARLALLTSFFLQVINAAISPKIAALFEKGQIKEVEKMLQHITKGLGIVGIIPFLFFLFFGKTLLGLWSKEFTSAYTILLLLSFGQFINIASGVNGSLLAMTGNEKILGKIKLVELCSILVLFYVMITLYGLLGAAISSMLIIIVFNVVKYIYVRKKLNINPISLKVKL